MQTTKQNLNITLPNAKILKARIQWLILMSDEVKQLSFGMFNDILERPLVASDYLVEIYLDHYEKKLKSASRINNRSKAATCAMLHTMLVAQRNHQMGEKKKPSKSKVQELQAMYFAKITRASIEGEAA